MRGVIGKFGDWQRNYRDVGRVAIQTPEIGTEIVADYVWVTDVPHWKCLKGKEGHQVEFEAVVTKYIQRSNNEMNYCMTNASDPKLIHPPPTLSIPDPPFEEEPTQPDESEMEDTLTEEGVNESPVSRDAIQDWRLARTFAKACGTSAKALDISSKMPDMPVALLREYLTVLSEE